MPRIRKSARSMGRVQSSVARVFPTDPCHIHGGGWGWSAGRERSSIAAEVRSCFSGGANFPFASNSACGVFARMRTVVFPLDVEGGNISQVSCSRWHSLQHCRRFYCAPSGGQERRPDDWRSKKGDAGCCASLCGALRLSWWACCRVPIAAPCMDDNIDMFSVGRIARMDEYGQSAFPPGARLCSGGWWQRRFL